MKNVVILFYLLLLTVSGFSNRIIIKYSPYDCANCNLYINEILKKYNSEIVLDEKLINTDTSDLQYIYDLARLKNIKISFDNQIYSQFTRSSKTSLGIFSNVNNKIYEVIDLKQINFNTIDSILQNKEKFCLASNNKQGGFDHYYENNITFTNSLNKKVTLLNYDGSQLPLDNYIPQNIDTLFYLKALRDTASFLNLKANSEYYNSRIRNILKIKDESELSFLYSNTVVRFGNDNHSVFYSECSSVLEHTKNKINLYKIDTDELIENDYVLYTFSSFFINNTLYIPAISNIDSNKRFAYLLKFIKKDNTYVNSEINKIEIPNYLQTSGLYNTLCNFRTSNGYLFNPMWNIAINLNTNKIIKLPIEDEEFIANKDFLIQNSIENIKFFIYAFKYDPTLKNFTLFYKKQDKDYLLRFPEVDKKLTQIVAVDELINSEQTVSHTLNYYGTELLFLRKNEYCIESIPLNKIFKANSSH